MTKIEDFIPSDMNDDDFMALAIKLSRRGLGRCAPNPNVGAVIVREDVRKKIIARGWTQPAGRPHAEKFAIDIAGQEAKGASLYVTLEPCSHYGKTPPCTDAIIESGITRVVYGIVDPDKRVCGRGIEKLSKSGVVVEQTSARLQAEAEWVMKGFLLNQTRSRPFVQIKMAVDCNGNVPMGNGKPVWITGSQARAYGHMLRAEADAILIGRGTALTDNPSLTCRLPGMSDRSPIRVILDTKLRLPNHHNLLDNKSNTPTWILHGLGMSEVREVNFAEKGVKLIPCELNSEKENLEVKNVLSTLSQNAITRLMVEGGPAVYSTFFSTDYVDEIVVFQSKSPINGDKQPALNGKPLSKVLECDTFQLVKERPVGVDIMKTYRRRSYD